MIGSCCAAMISVGFGVEALSIGVGGLPGILSIKPQYYLIFLLAMAVAIVVPFVLTFIVGRIKLSKEDRFGKENTAKAVKRRPLPKRALILGKIEQRTARMLHRLLM